MHQLQALLLLLGGIGPGQSPAGLDPALQPVLYDDCGSPGRQPHVGRAGDWTFGEEEVAAALAARTVAFDGSAVLIRYDRLDAKARYGLRVVYTTERGKPRTQRLLAEGQELHGPLALPDGVAEAFEFPLPEALAADGALELAFEHVTGPNAVVSEVWLLSDVPHPALNVSLDSDLSGGLTVRAEDGLLQPVPGAEVVVSGLAGAHRHATTGEDGAATLDLTSALPADASAQIAVTVTATGLTQEEAIRAGALLFRRPVLTPVPDVVPGLRRPTLDLSGGWRFSSAPAEGFWQAGFDDAEWSPIEAPGEWVMQGFAVPAGQAAGYRCGFVVPQGWRNHAVKLRFDAVYSLCRVWLNGVPVGSHEGGFTPFEVDVTDAARPSERNELALAVTSESMADTLATGSQYARHPLGGITRKVTAFAAPRTHLIRFHVTTDLDRRYRDGELIVQGNLAGPLDDARVRLQLTGPDGEPVPIAPTEARPSADGDLTMRASVPAPHLWDAEHPNLYTLSAEVLAGGKVTERVSRRIGFREVEVRGAELLVNGRPVKLRGVCRHEVHPERGRSLTPEIWQRDINLLKGANVNYVRTAHYPPAEEFINLCDEAGIYVQEEGPWCWVSEQAANSPETLGLLLRSNAEMLERDLSHPSIIIWDLANESHWGANFARLLAYTREADPTRPTLFSYQPDPAPTDIITWHYPGPGGPARTAASDKPITFDEYCHLNCYNPDEVIADPGLRDYWGRAIAPMWDAMYGAPQVLGGAIWCWADDVFDLPGAGRVGYGEWGIVDGWRRPKPEWWHLKQAYSPVRVRLRELPPAESDGSLRIPVENRFDFTDLSESECRWRLGRQGGSVRREVPPRTSGELVIPATPHEGDRLQLTFLDPAGRTITEYVLAASPPPASPADAGPPTQVRQVGEKSEIVGRRFRLTLNHGTGRLRADVAGVPVLLDGPWVTLTELETGREAADAALDQVEHAAVQRHGSAVHILTERLLAVGKLVCSARIAGNGVGEVDYSLAYTGPEVSVREVGLKWLVSPDCGRLSWRRQGEWTVYSDDHIGQLVGHALALPPVGQDARPPSWSADPDSRGTNDFRSTKYNVLEAALARPDGSRLEVLSDGSQHVRATVQSDGIMLRVSDFSNGGGERFLASHYGPGYRTLKPGDALSGTVRLKLVPKP